MSNHKKPTDKELEDGIDNTLKDLENMNDDDQGDDESDKIEEDENENKENKGSDKEEDQDDSGDDEGDDDKSDDKDKKEDKKSEDKQDDKRADDKEEDDELKKTKKNYADSTREAQILAAQRKKTNEAIDEAANITDVPDDEMRQAYPKWDEMDDVQQQLAKDNIINKKRFALINSVRETERDVEAWQKKVDEFIADPKKLADNPDLEGKEDEFKVFAAKESRRGADFELLTSAFLRDYEKSKPKHKGEMFPTGGGGDKKTDKREDGKISFEEGQRIAKNDSRRYATLLKEGKIADPIF